MWPASSRERSSRSFTCLRSSWALRSITAASRRSSSGIAPLSSRRWAGPRIKVNGVRSSWLTLAKNWVFRRSISASAALASSSAVMWRTRLSVMPLKACASSPISSAESTAIAWPRSPAVTRRVPSRSVRMPLPIWFEMRAESPAPASSAMPVSSSMASPTQRRIWRAPSPRVKEKPSSSVVSRSFTSPMVSRSSFWRSLVSLPERTSLRTCSASARRSSSAVSARPQISIARAR